MKIYGLIGNPLTHSFSQKYFSEKFRKENIEDCNYLNFQIENIDVEIERLKHNPLLCGLNITIPYKSEIIRFLDKASKECQEINACNCIKIQNRKWNGFNTDITGFEQSFAPFLRPHNTKALILGTGGSSKAVAYVLKKLVIDFLFVSRKNESVNNVIFYNSLTESILQEYTVVINTTPLGMFPNVHDYPQLPYEYITPSHYFFDLIYNPSKTIFLAEAEKKGAVIKNGEDMLQIQAEESWKIWNNPKQ